MGPGVPTPVRARIDSGMMSQVHAVASPDAKASRVPSGLKATAWTWAACPRNPRTSRRPARSHRRTVLQKGRGMEEESIIAPLPMYPGDHIGAFY